MRPLMLRLLGFTGIRAGQQKDEITLDLEPYRDDPVVALVGANGSGKTTVVDNLHPYLTMPSRAGEGGGFSFYVHVEAEAEKEFVFCVGDTRYRSLVIFSTAGKTRSTEAYLFRWDANTSAWEPYVSVDGVVVDGKRRVYEAAVEELCGPAALYFTAIHQAQGKRALYAMPNGDVKALLVSMLGLDAIIEIGAKAKETVKAISAALAPARAQRQAALDTAKASLPEQQRQAADAEAAIAHETMLIASTEAQSAVKSSALDALKRSAINAAATQSRIIDLIAKRDQIVAKLTSDSTTLAGDEQQQRSTMLDATAQTKTSLAQINQTISALRAEAAQLAAKLAERGAVDVARAQLPALRDAAPIAQAALALAKTELEAEKAREAQLTLTQHKLASIKAAGSAQDLMVKSKAEQASMLAVVPCNGMSLQAGCSLLSLAHQAGCELPQAQQALTDMRAEYAALAVVGKSFGEVRVAAKALALTQAEQGAQTAVQHLQAAELLAARHGEFVALKERGKAIGNETPIVESEKTRLEALVTAHQSKDASLRATFATRLAALKAQAEADAAVIDAELARLKTNDATAAISALVTELAAIDAAILAARARVTAQTAKRAVAAARLEDMNKRFEQADGELKRLDAVEAEQGVYTLLSKAFGNDGIVALLIDEAGPVLAAIANELLLACYGPRFTVEVKTLVATATGILKEGFEIVVHDGQSGQSKPVSVMSGGERVWIDQCIVRALSIHLAKTSGRVYDTLVSDETDGPLDEERKRQFMAMKREALRVGSFRQEIFISQTPELCAQADAVIRVCDL